MTVQWEKTTEKQYDEMLCVLPPAEWTSLGFLVGEASDHATCPVTGKFAARFACYIRVNGQVYASRQPISVAGLKVITREGVAL